MQARERMPSLTCARKVTVLLSSSRVSTPSPSVSRLLKATRHLATPDSDPFTPEGEGSGSLHACAGVCVCVSVSWYA